MARKTQTQKWMDEILAFANGKEPTCPVCGGHDFNNGYLELNTKKHVGWGAVWCEDCRSAFALSRVILTNEDTRQKIVSVLPADLKFV